MKIVITPTGFIINDRNGRIIRIFGPETCGSHPPDIFRLWLDGERSKDQAAPWWKRITG